MKFFALVFLAAAFAACDVRSGTAKREMEKYTSTPEPPRLATPEPSPISSGDIVGPIDTTLEGKTISVEGYELKKIISCLTFDRVMINGDKNVLTVKGICKQIMVNGDGNEVKLDAAAEFVLNGSGNSIRYGRYVNGQRPVITENKPGNIIEKVFSTEERLPRTTKK